MTPAQTDIRIVWDIMGGRGDWQMSGTDLLRGDDLATVVFISLFTDALAADDDEIPDGTSDRRGWWGDPKIGSRLWLLTREKLTLDTAARAETYGREALQWLIDDGIAVRVDLKATPIFGVPGKLILEIVLYKTDGTRRALNFVWVWNGIG